MLLRNSGYSTTLFFTVAANSRNTESSLFQKEKQNKSGSYHTSGHFFGNYFYNQFNGRVKSK